MSPVSDLASRAAARAARLPGPVELRRFAHHLGSPTRASAVRGALDGVVVAWTLRRRGARHLIPTPGGSHGPGQAARGRTIADAVDAGLRVVPMAPTCLRRSLTLSRELHRLGIDGTVHLGVRRRAGAVEAHAWVQIGDAVVNDDPAEVATYSALAAGELELTLPSLR